MNILEKLKTKVANQEEESALDAKQVSEPMLDRINNQVTAGISVWCKSSGWAKGCDKVNLHLV